jgi:hypothetical protein
MHAVTTTFFPPQTCTPYLQFYCVKYIFLQCIYPSFIQKTCTNFKIWLQHLDYISLRLHHINQEYRFQPWVAFIRTNFWCDQNLVNVIKFSLHFLECWFSVFTLFSYFLHMCGCLQKKKIWKLATFWHVRSCSQTPGGRSLEIHKLNPPCPNDASYPI